MNADAEALQRAMDRISARAYPSGRLEHLEFVLWYAVVNGPMHYGRTEITAGDIAELRSLSYACGGWITMDRAEQPVWVELREWQDLFTRNMDLVRLG